MQSSSPKTIHGRETRSARRARYEKIAELQMLEEMGRALGFITGQKTRGPKCKSKLIRTGLTYCSEIF
jgi:hypothetical protein